MKKIISIILLVILFSKNSFGQEEEGRWLPIGDGLDSSKLFMDINTMFAKEDVFGVKQVWIKVIEPKYVSKVGGKTRTHYNAVFKQLYEIKCSTNEMRLKQYAFYTSKGELIISNELYDSFSTVIPESFGELIFKKSCVFK